MGDITVVTAFFDIGRGDLPSIELLRANEKYYSYFKHWARLKNDMIVYTESKSEKMIKDIREEFGLGDKTQIIIIDNIFEQELDLYKRMEEVSAKAEFRAFRFFPNAFSNSSKYDYIVMMKYYFLQDACKRKLVNDFVAWIDFGYDHGGDKFYDSSDFDFIWKYDFVKKINIFCLTPPTDISGIDSLQFLQDTIMGTILCLPKTLTAEFWTLIKQAMLALLMIDCIDDDQQLLLMAYKARPELFEVHITDWFLPIKEYGGNHMKVSAEKKSMQKNNKKIIYAVRAFLYKLFHRNANQKFAKRSFERAGKYYG